MIPINFKALLKKATGKSNMFEVQSGEVFFKNNRVVTAITHLSDYDSGVYTVGDQAKVNSDTLISPLFNKRKDCDKTIMIPSSAVSQFFKLASAYKTAVGKTAKEIVLSIVDNGNDGYARATVHAERPDDDTVDLNASVIVSGCAHNHNTKFRFKVDQFLDFLYLANTCNKEVNIMQLDYTNCDPQGINDLPLFLDFDAFDHGFRIGHQVVPEDEPEKVGEADPEKEKGICFVDEDGQVKEELKTESEEA